MSQLAWSGCVCHNHALCYCIHRLHHTLWRRAHVCLQARARFICGPCLFSRPLMMCPWYGQAQATLPPLTESCHSPTPNPSPPPILSHFGNFWRRYHPCLSRHNDFSLIVENLKIKNSTWRPKGFLFKGKIPAYQIPELEFLVESDQVELGHMLPRVPACMLCAAANHVQVSTHHVVSLGSTLPCSLGTHGSKFPPHEALVLHCLS